MKKEKERKREEERKEIRRQKGKKGEKLKEERKVGRQIVSPAFLWSSLSTVVLLILKDQFIKPVLNLVQTDGFQKFQDNGSLL